MINLKPGHTCETLKTTVFKVGDAIIGEDKKPRWMWKIGRIEELFPGRDDLICYCVVPTPAGSFLERSVQLIYPDIKGDRKIGKRQRR